MEVKTWGGGSDSYFEYLIKHARLSNTNNKLFANTWLTAVDSSIKTLLRTSTVGNRVYLADFDDNKQIRHVGSHLACFDGGNWILGMALNISLEALSNVLLTGGRLLNNQTIVNVGLQLVDACWNTYASTQYAFRYFADPWLINFRFVEPALVPNLLLIFLLTVASLGEVHRIKRNSTSTNNTGFMRLMGSIYSVQKSSSPTFMLSGPLVIRNIWTELRPL
jgi:hypothetical protein